MANDDTIDPAADKIIAKVRRLMVISGAFTMIAVAGVIGVIGYRIFRSEGTAAVEARVNLPQGARVVATTAADDRLLVTIETGGATEVLIFDLRTLRQTGRLRLGAE